MADWAIGPRFGPLDPDEPGGRVFRRVNSIDRVTALICAFVGLPLLGLQVSGLMRAWPSTPARGATAAAVLAVGVGMLVLCVLQSLERIRVRVVPPLAAVLLAALTVLMAWVGVRVDLPGAAFGPVIFFLVLCISTEWQLAWPLVFVGVYAVAVPLLASEQSPLDILCAVLALGFHGIGFRFVVRAIQRHERAVEEAEAEARARTVAVQGESVALLERTHWDTLVHDHVINVLRSAANTHGESSPWLRAESRRTLALMNAPVESASTTTASEVARRLSAVVQGIAPGAVLSVESGSAREDYDSTAVTAIVAACGEALRNAVRHSGAEKIEAAALLTQEGIAVTVTDDGIGFDQRHVRPSAMGIRGSITGRMAGAGGRAAISSREGGGTSVRLEWAVPEEGARP
ncbi:sensor histidine kinase [Arthrobacter sp. UM1]|uniref:sensor histidine kinase n=1 Tax=Arthrobacter sp. UM1 TaxID=2766776 RepID=UPI001CF6D925|nr:ATP-binding protein [Arthrobacter sp. UM1]MCB4208466.1 ATP-binding protein [Arthrobacter sp. UM1]